MADPFRLNDFFAPKRVEIQPRPPTFPSTTQADPNNLMLLADMLKRTQRQRIEENSPATLPSSVAATPPALPPFNVMPAAATAPPVIPTQSATVADARAMPAAPVVPPTVPPVAAPMTPPNPAPNLPPASDAQSNLPPMPPPAQIGPVATSTSIWDTLKKMLANGQVPEGYRGAMGEMIKNT